MTTGRLALFLRYLSALPSPPEVLRALALGPLAPLGMCAGMLWRVSGDTLVSIASLANPPSMEQRYSRFPIQLDVPISAAAREGRIVVVRRTELPDLMFVTALDEQVWGDLLAHHAVEGAAAVPVTFAGETVGVLGLVVDRPWADDGDTAALLGTLTHALGLWATHPATGVASTRSPASSRAWSLDFSARQRQVLRLVDAGMSTPEIARHLTVSQSAIKQDLQSAMRALRADDRRVAAQRARDLGLV